MKYEDKLISFLENNNGCILTRQFEEIGIPRVHIPQFIGKGIIRKAFRGMYVGENHIEDEYYFYQVNHSHTIFSHNTAFHLQNMTERTPHKMEITTYRGKNVSDKNNIKTYYVAKDKLYIGVIEVKSPYGNKVKTYNLERSICDMIRYRNDFDLEIYNKIIKRFFSRKDKNLKRLLEYAKIFNISEKVNTIVEVMIKW